MHRARRNKGRRPVGREFPGCHRSGSFRGDQRFALQGYLWICQISFKLGHKLSDVQTIRQGVMHVDGDWHREALPSFCDLSKRNLRSRILTRVISGMRDGGEIQPREHGESDQVVAVISLQIVSSLHPVHFTRSLSHKRQKLRLIRIVSKSDGSIRTPDRASAMYGRVSPYRAVHDASHKVFDLMRCGQSAVNQCQED